MLEKTCLRKTAIWQTPLVERPIRFCNSSSMLNFSSQEEKNWFCLKNLQNIQKRWELFSKKGIIGLMVFDPNLFSLLSSKNKSKNGKKLENGMGVNNMGLRRSIKTFQMLKNINVNFLLKALLVHCCTFNDSLGWRHGRLRNKETSKKSEILVARVEERRLSWLGLITEL